MLLCSQSSDSGSRHVPLQIRSSARYRTGGGEIRQELRREDVTLSPLCFDYRRELKRVGTRIRDAPRYSTGTVRKHANDRL
jgi:hypothetical protein